MNLDGYMYFSIKYISKFGIYTKAGPLTDWNLEEGKYWTASAYLAFHSACDVLSFGVWNT